MEKKKQQKKRFADQRKKELAPVPPIVYEGNCSLITEGRIY